MTNYRHIHAQTERRAQYPLIGVHLPPSCQQVDLSAPKVDILVGLNRANPSAIASTSHINCHPLSLETKLRILKNPATRDFAPNNLFHLRCSVITRNSLYRA